MKRKTVLVMFTLALALYPGMPDTIVAEEPIVQVDWGQEQEQGADKPESAVTQWYGDPLDLQGCQQYCRSMHGVDPYSIQWRYGRHHSGGGLTYSYSICLQDCDRRFWKAYDAEMGKLGKDSQ